MTLKLEDISKPKIVDFLSVKIDFFGRIYIILFVNSNTYTANNSSKISCFLPFLI